MRVALVGAGSMGTILGAYLAKGGCDIMMVDNYVDHVNAMNEKGATVCGFADFTVPVKACTPDKMEGIYDIVILFTKQTANDEILPIICEHINEASTVCTLQNGVPEPFVAKYVGEERTVGGTVLWGATFCEPGKSELTQKILPGDPCFDIGTISGEVNDRIKAVKSVLDLMGPAVIMENLMEARWGKLIANACMSGMSAACGTTFGGVLENPKAKKCLTYLGHEVKMCCNAAGYKLQDLAAGRFAADSLEISTPEMFQANQDMFALVYSMMLGGKASMLQDLEKGRKTEVPMINGYVCETGRKYGIPTPFNDTVVEIVSKIEKGELPLSVENVQYFKDEWFTYGA